MQKRSVKLFFGIFTGICVVMVGILCVECAYFACVLKNKDIELTKSDAIIVFMGSEKRVKTGYELANKGLASRLVLSPATESFRQRRDKKYSIRKTVVHIPEENASTTFENALYASRIISAHQLKNVTLVTSDYHMPRSLALLRLFLAGKGVHIQPCPVHADTLANKSMLLKLTYNEMVEFWGSLLEYISWQATGQLPEKSLKKSQLSILLRSLFLLDVKPTW